MKAFLDFAGEHQILAFFFAALATVVALTMINLISILAHIPFRIYNRRLRHKSIMQNGWPTAPIDADGDVVYPKPKETQS